MSQRRIRPPSFKLEIPADEPKKINLQEKLGKIRNDLTRRFNRPVNNCDILDTIADYWIQNNVEGEGNRHHTTANYTKVNKSQVNSPLFVTTKASITKLIKTSESHDRIRKSGLQVKRITKRGHVSVLKLVCGRSIRPHTYLWSSSPFMKNGRYLVNERISHAFICSGMLPSHYARFANGAGIGLLSVKQRDAFFKNMKIHSEDEYKESISDALLEEIGSYEDLSGIEILTDARHGWRKNSKDTSVVAVGEKSHKVIACVNVTKGDDHIAQRHERVGTEKIYKELSEKDVTVRVHTHDRDMTINKMVKGKPLTLNQNDTWHGVKAVKKAMMTVSAGPKYKEGQTWSEELKDKVEPVCTHFHWAIRQCGGDSAVMKASLDNIIEHYKNSHKNCSTNSRCRTDPNYEPSRVVIEDPVAEKLLRGVITNSIIYKNPDDFNLGRDTFLVESFNNTLNIYEDKRIAFGSEQYKMRSYSATCHSNENVDRPYTSISSRQDPRAPRRQSGKKVLKRPTYIFRNNTWKRYVNKVYS